MDAAKIIATITERRATLAGANPADGTERDANRLVIAELDRILEIVNPPLPPIPERLRFLLPGLAGEGRLTWADAEAELKIIVYDAEDNLIGNYETTAASYYSGYITGAWLGDNLPNWRYALISTRARRVPRFLGSPTAAGRDYLDGLGPLPDLKSYGLGEPRTG